MKEGYVSVTESKLYRDYWQLRKEEKHEQAMRLIQEGSAKNDPVAMYLLSNCYWHGIGVNNCIDMAIMWARKSALLDCPEAMVEYSYHCLGNAREEWGRKAIESGNSFVVGSCHYYGLGIEKDIEKAINYFMKATNIESFTRIGDRYNYDFLGDQKLALEWYMKGAIEGDAVCQENLGFHYYYGSIIDRNLSEAVIWCKKGAKQGYYPGIKRLIPIFDEMGDLDRAYYWLKKYESLGYLDTNCYERPIFRYFERCEDACNTLMLIRKLRPSILSVFPKDVVRLIAKQLWAMRKEECWECSKKIKLQ